MPKKAANKLEPVALKTLGPGKHADAEAPGLYLQVDQRGNRQWLYRYQRNKKRHEMGLGPFPLLSLAEARKRATRCRLQLLDGIDPLTARAAERAAAAAPTGPAFGQVAEQHIQAHRASWKSTKHEQQWRNTLQQHAAALMAQPVAEVGTDHVLGVLRPIWATKTETATRLRERIEAILDHAVTLKHRPADAPNPARWKGHLSNVLPKPKKITPVEHHAALPWKEAPAFFAKLRETLSAGSLALQWLILSATRANETAGAEWKEVDLQAKTWTIPGSRTKTRKEHIVPITSRMLVILEMLPRRGTHLFPGNRGRASLNPESLRRALQRDMGREDLTVHGWRSTFRDWALENGHSREIAELSLAHTSGNAVEDAYRRGTALQLRAGLMQAWSDYLLGVQP